MQITIQKTLYNTKPLQVPKAIGFTLNFLKRTVTKKHIFFFLKKYPRIIEFSKYLLLLTAFCFMIIAFQELFTLKTISKPEFYQPFCTHNFLHRHDACIQFLRGLSIRYLYDAGRFFLAPLGMLFVWGIYKAHGKERLLKFLNE